LSLVSGDRDRTSAPIDCQEMVQSAPAGSPWVPQCDDANRMRPLQVKTDGSKFCVDIYVASVLLEQGTNSDISCECLSQAQETLRSSKKPMFVPECDPMTGAFLPKQCNRRGECWCVDLNGRQLGPKWGNKTTLLSIAHAASKDPTQWPVDRNEPRPSCEFIAKYWNDRMSHVSTQA